MTSLTVLDFSGKNIRFERRGDRVWVSLTDMAKATGKQVGHWTRLDGTIEYLTKLESVLHIRITETAQGGIPESQGTWAIEEVAIKFAMWCNVEFEIWVTQQIRTLMTEGVVAVETIAKPEPTKLGSSVATTISMLSPLKMLLSSVPDALVDGFLLNQVQAYHPEIKDTINAAHGLLAATNAIPEVLLTPTAIGKRLGVSARIVNAVLIANGYQIKNASKGKTEPAYLPTEKSKEFSSNTLATGRSTDNTSYQHIKWQESIVGIVQDLIE